MDDLSTTGGVFGYHPYPTYVAEPGESVNPEEIASDVYGGIDNSSRYVGALVLGALAALVAMKALGFRFAFGVKAGG